MINIQTSADSLLSYIEEHSPVKESSLPSHLSELAVLENYLRVLENNGMIEVKSAILSKERVFIFKTKKRSMVSDPWVLKPLHFG